MKILTVSIPDSDIEIVKKFVDLGISSNITEYIRNALREYLWDELEKL